MPRDVLVSPPYNWAHEFALCMFSIHCLAQNIMNSSQLKLSAHKRLPKSEGWLVCFVSFSMVVLECKKRILLMAQLEKCLPHQHKDLSLGPQTPSKARYSSAHIFQCFYGEIKRMMQESPKGAQAIQTVKTKRLHLKKGWKVPTNKHMPILTYTD